MYESWERFKELQRKCPHHGLPTWLIVQIFYNGLTHSMKTTVDAAAGGALMGKSADEAHDLLEEMISNSNEWSNKRGMPKKVAGIYEIDGMNMLNAKMDSLVKMFGKMGTVNAISNSIFCDNCGGSHMSSECKQVEQVHFASNFNRSQQNNPYSNTYNPGWRNHPNFSWNNQNNQGVMRGNLIHLDFSQDHNKLRLSHHGKLLLRD